MIQNEISYEKVIEWIEKHKITIFFHLRNETSRSAKIFRDMVIAKDKLNLFVNEDSERKKILIEVIIKKNIYYLLIFWDSWSIFKLKLK